MFSTLFRPLSLHDKLEMEHRHLADLIDCTKRALQGNEQLLARLLRDKAAVEAALASLGVDVPMVGADNKPIIPTI